MPLLKAIISGFAGACTVTLINESARQIINDAPRLDVLGKRALKLPLAKTGTNLSEDNKLYRISMLGDLVSNTAYYGLVGLGDKENALRNGSLLGLAAGVGAVILPNLLGLGSEPTAHNKKTEIMTIAWYLCGGLAAGAVFQAIIKEAE